MKKKSLTEMEMENIMENYLPSSTQEPRENALKEIFSSHGFPPSESSGEDEVAAETRDEAAKVPEADKSTVESTPASCIVRRISSKQRRMSLEEYRNTFLQVPKIDDRKPVFVSCDVRDKLDEFVRKLGGRKMSVSGLIENIARQHLDFYNEDFEQWRKL
jgi:hypothetical protein